MLVLGAARTTHGEVEAFGYVGARREEGPACYWRPPANYEDEQQRVQKDDTGKGGRCNATQDKGMLIFTNLLEERSHSRTIFMTLSSP